MRNESREEKSLFNLQIISMGGENWNLGDLVRGSDENSFKFQHG